MAHHATIGWMISQYKNYFQEDHDFSYPAIAETYGGLTNNIRGRHITGEHVLAALNSAEFGSVKEGNVGGGTGMMTYEFKDGAGTTLFRCSNFGRAYR